MIPFSNCECCACPFPNQPKTSAAARNVAVSFLCGRPSPELAVCHQEIRHEQNKSLFTSDPVRLYQYLDNDRDNFESSPNQGLLLP